MNGWLAKTTIAAARHSSGARADGDGSRSAGNHEFREDVIVNAAVKLTLDDLHKQRADLLKRRDEIAEAREKLSHAARRKPVEEFDGRARIGAPRVRISDLRREEFNEPSCWNEKGSNEPQSKIVACNTK